MCDPMLSIAPEVVLEAMDDADFASVRLLSSCPRLCRFFGLSAGYWLRAQAAYDIEVAMRALEPVLKKVAPWSDPAAWR
jgi:hypothetical protein